MGEARGVRELTTQLGILRPAHGMCLDTVLTDESSGVYHRVIPVEA
jgi:hypothetical protein